MRMQKALKNDGILYVSSKYGTEERTIDGHFYNDYNEEEIMKLLKQNGFTVTEIFITQDVRADRQTERWLNVIGRKKGTHL